MPSPRSGSTPTAPRPILVHGGARVEDLVDRFQAGDSVRDIELISSPTRLDLVGESRAGRPSERRLEKGEAMAISTGAMLPDGAGAVVRIEDTETSDGQVVVSAPVPPGNNIRHAGEHIAAGTTIGPAALGVLASLGIEPVLCSCRPRVAIVVSGDELVGPAESLGPGQIHGANAHTLRSLAVRAGAEVVAEAWVGEYTFRGFAAAVAANGLREERYELDLDAPIEDRWVRFMRHLLPT